MKGSLNKNNLSIKFPLCSCWVTKMGLLPGGVGESSTRGCWGISDKGVWGRAKL